jgi:flavorubredoxin
MDNDSEQVLYQDDTHKFIRLETNEDGQDSAIQTNQYLIIHRGKGILLDPGGVHLFSRVIASVSRHIALADIETVFFSHQDPDVSSGIALWMGVTPAKIYISGLWMRFLPHFGIVDSSRIVAIEETEGGIDLGSGQKLRFVPSHFLHSVGCYSLYDSRAKILFSGDIGAAVFEDRPYYFVDDFEAHKALIDGFHKRYMNSGAVLKKWVAMVSKFEIDFIAPQHGAVYRGEAVGKFLAYLDSLRCGTDFINELYTL